MVTEAEKIEVQKPRGTRRSEMFRALGHRNYRLFWAGAFLSNIGTWMQATAQAWLVYQLSNSSFLLGLDAFMATAPGFLLTLAGGVFADLLDRRRLLLYTQAVAGAAAIGLAVLIHTHVVQVWMILSFSFVTGCCMALAGPSYQAMTFDLVGREDVANAIALNSTQFQLSRVIGPFFFGLGAKLFGLVGCFYANGLSFAAVVVALAKVRFDETALKSSVRPVKDRRALWRDLIEGLRYVRNRPRVFTLLTIAAVNSFFGAPYVTLMPIFARDIFQLGETGLAWMMSAAGAGASCGALVLAYLGDFKRKGSFVLSGAMAFGLFIIAFAFANRFALSLVFLFCLGFALVASIALINTLLQKLVTDRMRGRVMSMFILSFMGTMPLGNLIAGAASHRFGARHTLAAGGLVVALVSTSIMLTNKRLRELH